MWHHVHGVGWHHEVFGKEGVGHDGVDVDENECQYGRQQDGGSVTSHTSDDVL